MPNGIGYSVIKKLPTVKKKTDKDLEDDAKKKKTQLSSFSDSAIQRRMTQSDKY